MLTLTKKTDYALIALKYMVDHGAYPAPPSTIDRLEVTPVSAREISEFYGLPLPLLMNILKELSGAGILASIRGARGGYVLAVNPKSLTLDRVITVIEGQMYLIDCATHAVEVGVGAAEDRNPLALHVHHGDACGCKLDGKCPVQSPLKSLHDRLARFFETITLDDICTNRMDRSLASLKLLETRV